MKIKFQILLSWNSGESCQQKKISQQQMSAKTIQGIVHINKSVRGPSIEADEPTSQIKGTSEIGFLLLHGIKLTPSKG